MCDNFKEKMNFGGKCLVPIIPDSLRIKSPIKSQKWPTSIFSLQHQNILKQKGYENKKKITKGKCFDLSSNSLN